MSVLDDYFAAEVPILAKLATLKPDYLKHVSPALNVDQVLAYSGVQPSAWLIYASAGVSNNTANKRAMIIETQTWIVAIAVRNMQDTRFNLNVRREAGPILYQIDRLLLGYCPYDDLDNVPTGNSNMTGTTPPEAFQNLPGIGIFLRAYNLSFANSGLRS
jgi:hypothetical protein